MRIIPLMAGLVLAFMLFSMPCLAEIAAKDYSIDYNIAFKNAVVYNKIEFYKIINSTLMFPLPPDAEAISAYIDGKKSDVIIENQSLVMQPNAKLVEFNYITKFFLDKNTFITDFSAPFDVDSLSIRVILPPKAAVLAQYNSVVPKADSYSSDGQSIIIEWEKQLKTGESIPILVRFSPEMNYNLVIVLAAIALAIIAGFFAIKKSKVKKEIETRVVKEIVKEDMVEKHLKEEEEQVVNVLKQREGSCEQGTLGVITGFPKATLSRILKELELRNIISKQKKGKKNLIFLRK